MTDVFIPKKKRQISSFAGLPILALVGLRPKAGDIGIEIEVEGNKFPKGLGYQHNEGDDQLIPKQWKYTQDGSLRGDDNAEYVLANPIKFDEVDKAVSDLWAMFAGYGTVLTDSNRTSVHVHLNVQQWHLNRLCSFVSMYFVVEELLTAWCGDHRVGNLFCLRGRDAPAIVRKLKEFFQKDGYDCPFSSGMHYAGLNPSAIHKFGSVEIRSLRGVNDPQVIVDWVALLERLYTLSAEFKDPRDVVSGFSGNGPMAWLQNILGPKYHTVVDNVPHTTDEIRDMLYEGIRLAQDLCYCRDWSEYKEVKVEPNPFGRQPSDTTSVTSIVNLETWGSSISSTASAAPPRYFDDYFVGDTLINLKEIGAITEHTYTALIALPYAESEEWLLLNGYLTVEDADQGDDEYEPDEDPYEEDL